MNKLILILVALMTVGCAEWWEYEKFEYPLHYYIDENSPAEMQAGVYEAAQDWNILAEERGVGRVFIFEDFVNSKLKTDKLFDVIGLDPQEYEDDVEDDRYYLGKCRKRATKRDAQVDILFAPHENIQRWAGNEDDLARAYYAVALHELGHALGIGHNLDEDELMFYYGREFKTFPDHITPGAEAEFCRLHGCK
jgi:hypothetical protein